MSDKIIIKKIGFLGEIILDSVVVVAVKSRGIKIIPTSNCGPSGCTNCNLCASDDNSNTIFYKIDNPSKYKKGQKINIKRFVFNEAIAAFTMFGIPISSALLLQIIWHSQKPETADSLFALSLTIIAMIFGGFVVFLIEILIKYHFPSTAEIKNE